jgi:hypothetical protein
MIDIPKIVTKIGIKPTFRLERNGATVTQFESLSFHWLFSRHAFHHTHISMKNLFFMCFRTFENVVGRTHSGDGIALLWCDRRDIHPDLLRPAKQQVPMHD